MKTTQTQEINKRIKYMVNLSKQIPWYARKYKELGINPDTIKTPQDLLKAYEKGLYTTPQDLPELVYYKHPEAKGPFYTSGTAGKPKEVWVNPDDEKRFILQCAKIYKIAFSKNDRILNCFPGMPGISGYGLSAALNNLGYSFTHFPAQKVGKDLHEFVNTIKELKPTVLMGLTTFVYRLPLILQSFYINPGILGFKSIITAGEPSSTERRKTIGKEFGDANVYDFYGTTENDVVAYEIQPFTDKQLVTIPETLLFLCGKDKNPVSKSEVGDVLITNLYEIGARPWSILINYKIGDWAKCVDKSDESGVVTVISEIRREAAYLAGAKLNPQEVEAIIDGLSEFKGFLTGEYCIITYNDADRKAVAEIRLEARKQLSNEQKKQISQQVRQKIYEANIPVYHMAEIVKDAKLTINITEPGSLYKGYEQHIKPGKPKRLIVL
jgi:phenylacetate-coenzyme A ligase PaaK-like adenylate-forming protein